MKKMFEYVIELIEHKQSFSSMEKDIRTHLYQAENDDIEAEKCKDEPIEKYKWISGSHSKDAAMHRAEAVAIRGRINEMKAAIEILKGVRNG